MIKNIDLYVFSHRLTKFNTFVFHYSFTHVSHLMINLKSQSYE